MKQFSPKNKSTSNSKSTTPFFSKKSEGSFFNPINNFFNASIQLKSEDDKKSKEQIQEEREDKIREKHKYLEVGKQWYRGEEITKEEYDSCKGKKNDEGNLCRSYSGIKRGVRLYFNYTPFTPKLVEPTMHEEKRPKMAIPTLHIEERPKPEPKQEKQEKQNEEEKSDKNESENEVEETTIPQDVHETIDVIWNFADAAMPNKYWNELKKVFAEIVLKYESDKENFGGVVITMGIDTGGKFSYEELIDDYDDVSGEDEYKVRADLEQTPYTGKHLIDLLNARQESVRKVLDKMGIPLNKIEFIPVTNTRKIKIDTK